MIDWLVETWNGMDPEARRLLVSSAVGSFLSWPTLGFLFRKGRAGTAWVVKAIRRRREHKRDVARYVEETRIKNIIQAVLGERDAKEDNKIELVLDGDGKGCPVDEPSRPVLAARRCL